MRRLAAGRHDDFGPAALAAFQVQRRCLANHDKIGLDRRHDLGQAQSFKSFFTHGTGDKHRTGQLIAAGSQRGNAANHCRQGAFHITGAAPINPAVFNYPFEWRHCPVLGITDIHRVHVAVEQDRRPSRGALDFADHVAKIVDPGPIITEPQHRLFQFLRQVCFRPRIALQLNHPLAQRD